MATTVQQRDKALEQLERFLKMVDEAVEPFRDACHDARCLQDWSGIPDDIRDRGILRAENKAREMTYYIESIVGDLRTAYARKTT
jgi:predicted RNA polymerase sigma factor